MNTGVLGTGMVGDAIGTKLVQLGHKVKMGSRTANNEKANAWVKKNGAHASAGTFEDAAQFGEIIFNCTSGTGSLDALRSAGSKNLSEKILIDISNPLDFSKGMPPSLTVSNTDSLGEQIQRAFPDVRVVKTLNTLSNPLMVNPSLVNGGDHTVFLSGNDAEAKAKVLSLLVSFGWKSGNVIDLGDITTARGTEQILPLWVRLFGMFQTPMFQMKIVK
ncbi:MAG: NAD(P)-binding domain-containing protein [Ignavibacteriales bacterium]|nr:NAD(P)-binding domain-containing protein [Ignavibacteriales bacterium]